ncbi:MAG: UDP-N-acetylglucosamine pyrophosphorylase [Clostridia bacterium]|nr:UDP-N-acetylglucosamine pyrophosphorylase [Clostridia bacterium]
MNGWWQDDLVELDEERPWEMLDRLPEIIPVLADKLCIPERCAGVWIAESATVAPSAVLHPPVLILDGARIAEWALLRGPCVVGVDAHVGHACEVKNSLLLRGSTAAHYNYLGDSILGAYAHLGAGAILSNLRLDERKILVQCGTYTVPSGRRKLGALVGHHAQIGCNAVLNPGTLVEPYAAVFPLTSASGYVKRR